MTTSTSRWQRSAVAGAALLVVAASAAGVGRAGAQEGQPGRDDRADRSRALTAAPAVSFRDPGRSHARPQDARQAAAQLGPAIPLPAGGQFSGIRYEDAGGGLTDADVESVLEYNAACQWWRALRDGRDGSVTSSVVTDIPEWPSFRGTAAAELARRVAEEIAAGGGPIAQGVLADCDAIHKRTVGQALARGEVPSS